MRYLSQAIEQYLLVCQKSKNLSALTIKAYKIDLEQFLQINDNLELASINKQSIEHYHFQLIEQELSARTIKRKLACLRAMFRWLELEELVEINPFNKIKTSIKLPKQLPQNITPSDLRKMIFQAKSELGLSQNRKLSKTKLGNCVQSKKDFNKLTTLISLELLLSTGMRISELANTIINNIELEEGRIKILGKGSRERYVYLPNEELYKLVFYYLISRKITQPDNDNFLVNSRGKRASAQFLRKLIRQLAQRADTSRHITPHMFRHSAACELLESGVDIRFVQRLLGHSSISTTEIYTHVNDKVLREKIIQANVRQQIMQKE